MFPRCTHKNEDELYAVNCTILNHKIFNQIEMLTFAPATAAAAPQALPKFALATAPDAKHTKTCNSAGEIKFGDGPGPCLGSL